MHLLTSLLLLIVFARMFGRLLQHVNQPPLVGEILAGVLLGPSVLNLIHTNEALRGISELAVFLVILSAGLEMNYREVLSAMRGKGALVALLGFALPFSGGVLVGLVFHLDAMRTVFLGLCISITALPVAVRILQSFNLLGTTIARYSVASAIFNDVLALLALGVILNLPEQRSLAAVMTSMFVTSSKLIALGAFILGFNALLQWIRSRGLHLERISERLVARFGDEALFGVLVIFVLVFASVSENLGFHFVIGAFFGALLIDRTFFLASRYRELERTLGSISGGFLSPVFFAYIGLEFNLWALKSVALVVVVLLVSIGTKLYAGWLGGRAIGLSRAESLGIGVILNGRGVMELVIASIAYDRGFIGPRLFSTLVLMGVVTTMITPLLLRYLVLPRLGPCAPTGQPGADVLRSPYDRLD